MTDDVVDDCPDRVRRFRAHFKGTEVLTIPVERGVVKYAAVAGDIWRYTDCWRRCDLRRIIAFTNQWQWHVMVSDGHTEFKIDKQNLDSLDTWIFEHSNRRSAVDALLALGYCM